MQVNFHVVFYTFIIFYIFHSINEHILMCLKTHYCILPYLYMPVLIAFSNFVVHTNALDYSVSVTCQCMFGLTVCV